MNDVTVYERIADPVQAVKSLGLMIAKSGMFGCTCIEQGEIIAFHSMCERKSPVELMRRYHLMEKKGGGYTLSMRAEAMLAEFMERGGRWVWKASDDTKAVAQVAYGDNDMLIAYTIEEAEKAGLIRHDKPGSNWMKNPAAMLRARLTSKAIRMVAPSVVVGIYTPDEINDDIVPTTTATRGPLLGAPPSSAPTPGGLTAPPAATNAEGDDPAIPGTSDEATTEEADAAGEAASAAAGDNPPTSPQDAVMLACADKGLSPCVITDYLKSLGWISPDGEIADLTDEHAAMILNRLEAFVAKVKEQK